MNKPQVAWLIVRLMGVYFSYLAVVTALSLPGAVSNLYSLSSKPNSAKPDVESVRPTPVIVNPRIESDPSTAARTDPAAEAKSEALKSLLKLILLSAIYGSVGFYLVRRGRILFNVLINESSAQSYENDPAVTTLKL